MPKTNRLSPVHPGEILFEDFLKPLAISEVYLAQRLGVSRRRVRSVLLGRRPVEPDLAERLAQYLGTSKQFWISLQATYDLDVRRDRRAAARGAQQEEYE